MFPLVPKRRNAEFHIREAWKTGCFEADTCRPLESRVLIVYAQGKSYTRNCMHAHFACFLYCARSSNKLSRRSDRQNSCAPNARHGNKNREHQHDTADHQSRAPGSPEEGDERLHRMCAERHRPLSKARQFQESWMSSPQKRR